MPLRPLALAALLLLPHAAQAATTPATLPENVATVVRALGYRMEVSAMAPDADTGDGITYQISAEGFYYLATFYNCLPEEGCAALRFLTVMDNPAHLGAAELEAVLAEERATHLAVLPFDTWFEPYPSGTQYMGELVASAETDTAAVERTIAGFIASASRLRTELAGAAPLLDEQAEEITIRIEDVAAALQRLGYRMEPFRVGSATSVTSHQRFTVADGPVVYDLQFDGCVESACLTLDLLSRIGNARKMDGDAFRTAYASGRFDFLTEAGISPRIRPTDSEVRLSAELPAAAGQSPARLAGDLAAWHRFLRTVADMAGGLAAAGSDGPVDGLARTPEQLADMLERMGQEARLAEEQRGAVIYTGSPEGPLTLQFHGCLAEIACTTVTITRRDTPQSPPDPAALNRFNGQSACCKAWWDEGAGRISLSISLPLREGLRSEVLKDAFSLLAEETRSFRQVFDIVDGP